MVIQEGSKLQAMRLKVRGSHLVCKVAHKCLDIRGRSELAEWNKKMVPSLPSLTNESLVSMKENLIEKKYWLLMGAI